MIAVDAHEQRERSEYLRAGIVAAAVVNANPFRKGRIAKPEDFIPVRRRRKTQTDAQMATLLKGYTLALGGQVIGA